MAKVDETIPVELRLDIVVVVTREGYEQLISKG
jgi:hypothetical protein